MNQKNLREELLKKIDKSSEIELEKVDRYCALIKHFKAIEKQVGNKNLIMVKNGSQQYVKANPGLNEMNKINAQIINLGKDMGLSAPPPEPNAGRGYDSSDLV
ncbi:MAG: P27 family phage terminase small subunit [Liquorilactobacillus ghanensis]|uniref:P27 family phage terminase small subunit n=1 Tax=Liquorilactobacillus ghanensis TaxID=399370 RepID=UPI0039E783FE